MRKFKSTPQKKFLGMVILFVLIPLFLLLYALFVIDWRPGPDTLIIAAAIAVLFFYLYRRYKKQLAPGQAAVEALEEPLEEAPVEGEADIGELPEDDLAEEPEEAPAPAQVEQKSPKK